MSSTSSLSLALSSCFQSPSASSSPKGGASGAESFASRIAQGGMRLSLGDLVPNRRRFATKGTGRLLPQDSSRSSRSLSFPPRARKGEGRPSKGGLAFLPLSLLYHSSFASTLAFSCLLSPPILPSLSSFEPSSPSSTMLKSLFAIATLALSVAASPVQGMFTFYFFLCASPLPPCSLCWRVKAAPRFNR